MVTIERDGLPHDTQDRENCLAMIEGVIDDAVRAELAKYAEG